MSLFDIIINGELIEKSGCFRPLRIDLYDECFDVNYCLSQFFYVFYLFLLVLLTERTLIYLPPFQFVLYQLQKLLFNYLPIFSVLFLSHVAHT